MEATSALSALGLTTVRGLDDTKRGPVILSHSFAHKLHFTEEMRDLKLLAEQKHLPEEVMQQADILEKLRTENFDRYSTNYVRCELVRVHEAYQTLRLKYKSKYQGKLPQPRFIGGYGKLDTETGMGEDDEAPRGPEFQDSGVLLEGRMKDEFFILPGDDDDEF
ncbi:uncharacterized protein LOC111698525 [Eurytemora carolleeae]|uniref:uncharacterized protein LOC111698525 n=1 Tax=Eurytemora carolleeae TaxID=1294199 RepID=UPI000C75A71F|nr:uncharacterized protein LOC111698525 [Eurytemora carolleeae]|eukprot:XP_023324648.1 uncharacterized protein LOC111698525 [Eurytemora affinis]